MEEKALTQWQPGQIEKEIVNQIEKITDDQIQWLKVRSDGFHAGDAFFARELAGTIIDAKLYAIQFYIGEPPSKIPIRDLGDIPENYELRCDIKIRFVTGELIGLSLPKSSTYALSRYSKRLSALGLCLDGVVTQFTPRSVANQKGRFTVVDFANIKTIDKPTAPQSKVKEDVDDFDIYIEDLLDDRN